MDNKHYISVKDHTVSGENFDLFMDADLELLYTSPKPEALDRYYESEDYISHTDGARSLFEKAYQFVKNIALKNKLALIDGLKSSTKNLLDIGAGTGDFLSTAKTGGWNTTGIEPSEKARSIAKKKGVEFVTTTSDLSDNSFDVITMWHVLEHVPDVHKQLAELNRLLKNDGSIVIAVPNFKSYDANHYGEFWAAYDVPRHLWHFSKTSIAKLAAMHGLKLERVLPMKFDSFYVSLLSEKYRHGKMRYFDAFLTGLRSNAYGKRTGEYSSHIYMLKKASKLKLGRLIGYICVEDHSDTEKFNRRLN